MSSPADDPDALVRLRPDLAPDAQGRTVVWSAGSPARAPRAGGAVRRVGALIGVVVAAAVAAFVLAYAVHAYVVVTPSPDGPAAPLWLPERLPADDPGPADDGGSSGRGSGRGGSDDHGRSGGADDHRGGRAESSDDHGGDDSRS